MASVRAMAPALVLGLFASSAAANGLFLPLASVQAQQTGQTAAPFLATQRFRDVMLDPEYLAARVAPLGSDQQPDRLAGAPAAASVRIELFSGVVLDLERSSITEAFGGGFIWTGQADAPAPGWADLVIRDGRVTGHVSVLHPQPTNYRIDPIGSGGMHRITELDGSGFPPPGHSHSHEEGHDLGHHPDSGDRHDHRPDNDHVTLALPDDTSMATIDVLIAYTSAAASTVADIVAQANLAVSLSNTGFSRSNVHIRFRLVGTHLVAGYVERDYLGMLEDLTDAELPAFQAVHDLRDSTGADLVGLLVASQQWCGYAWILPPSPLFHDFGYSLTTVSCINNYVFAHELGHNMGLEHDRFVLGHTPHDSIYHFGHVSGWNAGRFLTIMAYRNACPSCARINNFSNPDVIHNGFPTGIPAGTAGAADAARWLNEVRHVFAAFRPTNGRVATTTVLTAPTSAVPGALLTFEARVTAQDATPTGFVRFRRDGEVFSGVRLDGSGVGRVSFNSPALPEGTHRITAHFDGDAQFRASESAVHVLTIAQPSAPVNNLFANRTPIPAPGRVTGTNLGATSQPGQPAIAVANSDNAVWWSHVPAQDGTLTIDTFGSDFNTTLAVFTGTAVNALTQVAANDDANGRQSRVSFPVTGGVQYQIAVAGHGNATGTITLNLAPEAAPGPTVTTLAGTSSSEFGSPVTVSATVSSQSGTPVGSVSFRAGETEFAVVALIDGAAQAEIVDLPVGTLAIVATYGGGAGFRGSASAPLSHTVRDRTTQTHLGGADSSVLGDTVTFVARVLSGPVAPTGSVSLVVNGTQAATVALSDGEARFTTSSLQDGENEIVALYAGGYGLEPSRSAVLRHRVSRPQVATTTTLLTPFTAIQGQPVTLSATVTAARGTPDGTVSFRRDGLLVADATLNAQGQAMVNRMDLPIGNHQITAHYPGNAGFAASTSAVWLLRIDPVPNMSTSFLGGGAVFGQTDACNDRFGTGPHAVTVAYAPSELNNPPSGVSIFWRDGSEHLALWGPLVPSGSFLGAAGRQSRGRFVFYPLRPLIRVVQRQITLPETGSDIATGQELVLRMRVQNFGAIPGCAATVTATLRRAG